VNIGSGEIATSEKYASRGSIASCLIRCSRPERSSRLLGAATLAKGLERRAFDGTARMSQRADFLTVPDGVVLPDGNPTVNAGSPFCQYVAPIEPDWKPAHKRLLITVATGKSSAVARITRPAMETYARFIGADFVTLDNRTQTWPLAEKFRIGHFASRYERTLYLDADVFVRDCAPDIFETVPAGAIALHNDFQEGDGTIPPWLQKENESLSKSQGSRFRKGAGIRALSCSTGPIPTFGTHRQSRSRSVALHGAELGSAERFRERSRDEPGALPGTGNFGFIRHSSTSKKRSSSTQSGCTETRKCCCPFCGRSRFDDLWSRHTQQSPSLGFYELFSDGLTVSRCSPG
jgi:hypothetical protein